VGWTCNMQEADNKCVQYFRKKNFGRDSWFPKRHETQDVQRMLYAASQYGHLPTIQSFAQHNSFSYIPCRPVRTLRIYPLPVLFQMYASSFEPYSCSDNPQYQLQGGFNITSLLGASRRFFWKRVWLRSAN